MVEKIRKLFTNRASQFNFFVRLGLYKRLGDDDYLKKRYRFILGRELNLDSPRTFNEKLQWLKIHDRRDIYTMLVDKYRVKEYVSGAIGDEYVIPTLGVYDSFDEIDFDKLPNQFVIKCTHDSGGLVVVDNKEKMNKKAAKNKITKALKKNFYYINREWPYKNVEPRIIVEKYMKEHDSHELIDYKVMCFNGKAKIIFTCTERFSGGLKVTFFDLDWNRLPFERHYPSSKREVKKPKNLALMIRLSESLSKDITFVRMDWYEVNGKLYFGEFTFYPGAGLEEFRPEEWDRRLGDMIDLGKVNHV